MSDFPLPLTLNTSIEGPVATVMLNRPQALNALDATMFNELERTFQELSANPAVRVIIVTGSGERAFAAGADIPALLETNTSTGLAVSLRGQHVFSQIEACGKPVIACINGAALGGGCELAMACTLRVASDKAKLGLPEVKLGLIPGYGGTQRLPRLVGRGTALRLMLTGEVLSAQDALKIGLLDEVVANAELKERTMELARTIAELAPLAIRGVLEAVRETRHPIGFEREAEIFSRLCSTEDKREGLTAFLEKRPARWQGR